MNNKILIVIDYQNDFVDGSLGFPEAKSLDEKIVEKIKEYGLKNVRYTLDTHDEDYLDTREGKLLPIKHCIYDTDGWRLYGDTGRLLNIGNVKGTTKHSFGMNSTEIENLKIPENVTSIELVGLVSNICVISNACVLQAAFPEATIIVNRSLCMSNDKDIHNKTMDVLKSFQVKVI